MRKKKKKLSGVRSGIRVYGSMSAENRNKRQGSGSWVLDALSVCMLAAAWWNAFLSVFPADISSVWLYGGIAVFSFFLSALHRRRGKKAAVCVFLLAGAAIAAGVLTWRYVPDVIGRWTAGKAGAAAAVLTVPLLELWMLVRKSGRARAAAGTVIPVPLIAAACAGYFQPVVPCWLLLIAGGFYFAAGSGGAEQKRENPARMWAHAFAVLALLCLTALLSASAGRLLDAGRDEPSGFYQEGRRFFSTGVADRLERMAADMTQDHTEEEQAAESPEVPQSEETNVQEEVPEREPVQAIMTEDQDMEDLNSLSHFAPTGAEVGVVTLPAKPSGTVYVAQRYGIAYTGDAWTDMEDFDRENSEPVYGPTQYADEGEPSAALLSVCLSYPSDLRELEGLLDSGWDTGSITAVERQIDEALEQRAVYDVSPGATPQGEDFVEYFLFERGRGFCVHFASASVLLYRMSGYPARYVSGYAVPVSAFSETAEGDYEARIDDTMGHAWAQVYDEQRGVWRDEEHTPSALSPAEDPAADVQGNGSRETEGAEDRSVLSGMPAGVLAGILILLALILSVQIQARVRRAGLRRRFSRKKDGAGIVSMYDSILKTAEFLGLCSGSLPDEGATKLLSEDFPEISAGDWKWMEERTQEAMFYHLTDEADVWRRMADLYCAFLWAARKKMSRGKRWMYDHIYCYGIVYKYTDE